MDKDPLVRPLITMNEACDRFGVTRGTIYNWLERQKLRCIKTAGGSIRIFFDDPDNSKLDQENIPSWNGKLIVSFDRACKIAGVSRRTMYNWIRDGKVKHQRTKFGDSIRVEIGSLFRE